MEAQLKQPLLVQDQQGYLIEFLLVRVTAYVDFDHSMRCGAYKQRYIMRSTLSSVRIRYKCQIAGALDGGGQCSLVARAES